MQLPLDRSNDRALAHEGTRIRHLRQQPHARCRGYLTCVKLGEEQCPVADDIRPLMAAMDNADAVIFDTEKKLMAAVRLADVDAARSRLTKFQRI